MEQPKLADVSKAAEQYAAVRDHRMELTREEVKKHDALLATMRAHDLTVYRDPDNDLLATLIEGKAKVKVKKAGEDDEEEDSEEEGD